MTPWFCALCGAPCEAARGGRGARACSATGAVLPQAVVSALEDQFFAPGSASAAPARMLYDGPWFCAACGATHATEPRDGMVLVDLRCAACERTYRQFTALMIVQQFRPVHGAARTKASPALAKLERRAKKGAEHVEVEHLIPFAKAGDARAAAPLRELASRHRWPAKGPGVPLAAWAEAIAVFLEGGPKKLARAVRSGTVDGAVALGLLAEVDGPTTIAACLAIAENPALATRALGALGSIFFRDAAPRTAALDARVRRFVHARLARSLPPGERATAFGILAAVGDASSLTLLKDAAPLRAPYGDVRERMVRRLEARLAKRRRAGTTNARTTAGGRHGAAAEKEDRDHRKRQRRSGARARSQTRRS